MTSKARNFTPTHTNFLSLISLFYTVSEQNLYKNSIYNIIVNHCEFFQYCDSNIGLFSIASCKAIDLPTIAVAIVGRAITVWEAIQKKP